MDCSTFGHSNCSLQSSRTPVRSYDSHCVCIKLVPLKIYFLREDRDEKRCHKPFPFAISIFHFFNKTAILSRSSSLLLNLNMNPSFSSCHTSQSICLPSINPLDLRLSLNPSELISVLLQSTSLDSNQIHHDHIKQIPIQMVMGNGERSTWLTEAD
jgi:hypothetical protein